MKKMLLSKISVLKALLLFLLIQSAAYSQVNFTDSNLPIVLITTDIDPATGLPREIPDEPKILGSMKIIYRPDGSRNYLTDQDNPAYLNYNGRIKIEIRGSSSQDLPKKQYGWTTLKNDDTSNNNVSLLGMPKENDWILNGLAFDPSLIRDYFTYNLSRTIGYYTSRTEYCEVMINGEYKGLYVLQEKLKADSDRINIEKIEDTDNTLPNLSGGYITKADKTTGGDPVAWTMDSYAGWTDFIHELPKPEDVTAAQDAYIHNQFLSLEATATNNNADLATGYPSVIDIPTFVDFMVMNELASNADGYQISTFFHKDRGGKLRAGPIWDFNLTYGNDLFMYGFDRSHTDVWQFSDGGNEGPKFFTDLFNNAVFKCYLSRRWHELTQPGQPLNYNEMAAYIDEIVSYIDEAAVREQQQWNTVPDHAQEIANMKNWLSERVTWITNNIGGFSECDAVVLPSLVITAINYNPDETTEFPESDDQEFIAIKNTGTTPVNLTGIYLRELGVSYQFPANSIAAPGEIMYIASNPQVFEAKYNTTPFGQFYRNLSNSTQELVLADGFGNIIDTVTYDDDAPWPDADGNGSYLYLTDINLDNALAQSWAAVSGAALSKAGFTSAESLTIYPNPASDVLTINSGLEITKVTVYDVYGKLLKDTAVLNTTATLNMNEYASGIYFVKVARGNNAITHKVIKP